MRGIVDLTFFFFFNDTATTEIYTLSLHDALPIWPSGVVQSETQSATARGAQAVVARVEPGTLDRKSTRLNSSHSQISYAVFCLKKKEPDGEAHSVQLVNELPDVR